MLTTGNANRPRFLEARAERLGASWVPVRLRTAVGSWRTGTGSGLTDSGSSLTQWLLFVGCSGPLIESCCVCGGLVAG